MPEKFHPRLSEPSRSTIPSAQRKCQFRKGIRQISRRGSAVYETRARGLKRGAPRSRPIISPISLFIMENIAIAGYNSVPTVAPLFCMSLSALPIARCPTKGSDFLHGSGAQALLLVCAPRCGLCDDLPTSRPLAYFNGRHTRAFPAPTVASVASVDDADAVAAVYDRRVMEDRGPRTEDRGPRWGRTGNVAAGKWASRCRLKPKSFRERRHVLKTEPPLQHCRPAVDVSLRCSKVRANEPSALDRRYSSTHSRAV